MSRTRLPFWSIPPDDLLAALRTTPRGLTGDEARRRLASSGANLLRPKRRKDALLLLLGQLKSPILMTLFVAAVVSFFLGDATDTIIILVIVLVSAFLGFWQEWGASNALEKLLAMVQVKAEVLRDGAPKEIPVEEVVPGEIVILNAGDFIPGDCLILESKDLFLDEAVLTGETYPVHKKAGALPADTPLVRRSNALLMGTHVVSGSGTVVVVHTGRETEFGGISERLALRPPETEFERGVRRFGYFLLEVTLLLVIAIFAFNVLLKRPVLDSLLFALALAVGLTPQLLPAIITVNLAHGARRMALSKVIVKRLEAIENFGSMNVLCSDKTGTLTEGVVRVRSALNLAGEENEKVFLYAYLNAVYEKGFVNPVDEAIRTSRQLDLSGYQKLDEVPFDFVRKRLSILVSRGESRLIVTKGAVADLLSVCSSAEVSEGTVVEISSVKEEINRRFEELSREGFRTLGVAYREVGATTSVTRDDEAGMTFLGFMVLYDPPKPGIVETLREFHSLGVSLKIVTGDNPLVANHLSQQIGLSQPRILSGTDLHRMSDEALLKQVREVEIFAEVEPNQKERIILALKKGGDVVGYMGDGINDAQALHVADVSISVDSAVDVAKDAADIVLLERDLGVLAQGIREGRTTFANTLKYVFMATSANFGNMFSMAGSSLFLPFLPLLPKQILLTNLLTDFPEMTIAMDNVDPELIQKPRRWDIRFIRSFMLTFGILSALFDFMTFGVLLLLFRATPELFRTSWLVESVISASLVVLIIRTRRPFFKSLPAKSLLTATLLVAAMTVLLPYTPAGAKLFEFAPLPLPVLGLMGGIVALYVVSAEAAKRVFYRRVRF